jgi:L-fuculose-phosphate aldolase
MAETSYLTDEQAKRDILEAGRRLYQRGFVAANDGNISARVSEREIWCTPSGVSKGFMTEDMLVKLDLEGNRLQGAMRPSSEIQMHLAIYRTAPDVCGVVHAHPPVSAAFSAAGQALDMALLQEAVVLLGVIPLAPFAMPGSKELAESVVPFVKEYNGALLEHHGAVAWGRDVMQALFRMESIEYNATVTMYARMMGLTRPMTEGQIDALIKLRPTWGITGGGRPKGRDGD